MMKKYLKYGNMTCQKDRKLEKIIVSDESFDTNDK